MSPAVITPGAVRVGHNGRGQVVIDFQQVLQWASFSLDEAELFAQAVLARVATLRSGAVTTPEPASIGQPQALAQLTARRETFEEVLRMVDSVRNDPNVQLDDELDAFRRLADRRRLAAQTEEERLRDRDAAPLTSNERRDVGIALQRRPG